MCVLKPVREIWDDNHPLVNGANENQVMLTKGEIPIIHLTHLFFKHAIQISLFTLANHNSFNCS